MSLNVYPNHETNCTNKISLFVINPRKTDMVNIDKIINCGDTSFSSTMYGCPHYGKLTFAPFRCHSRFYPTCCVNILMHGICQRRPD
ncbi:MAG: transposase zinc-binding domain-containing protein [Acetatifactor sp.]|nr:transposase zinc-binding domain-containing protein [Acetatifactor sp.]